MSAEDGKKTGDRTGVGFFIPLPKELADQFPPLGENDRSPSHCTFLYVGSVTKEQEPKFLEAVQHAFEQLNRPVTGSLYALDYFLHPEKNRRVAVMRVRFNQRLDEIRWKVRDAIMAAGIAVDDTFPLIYQPHVTLAYMQGLTKRYDRAIPQGQWTFDSIEIWGLPELVTISFMSPDTRIASRYMEKYLK